MGHMLVIHSRELGKAMDRAITTMVMQAQGLDSRHNRTSKPAFHAALSLFVTKTYSWYNILCIEREKVAILNPLFSSCKDTIHDVLFSDSINDNKHKEFFFCCS